MRLSKKIFYILVIAYFPCLFVLPLLLSQSTSLVRSTYWFHLLAYAVLTLPFFLAYLELGYQIILQYERRALSKGQKAFRLLGALLAGLTIVAMLISFTGFAKLWLIYLISAVILIPIWIVRAILSKSRPHVPAECRSKSFLITSIGLVAIILLTGLLCLSSQGTKGRRYSVTFADEYAIVHAEEHKRGYREGEKVVIQLKSGSDCTYTLTANGKEVPIHSADAEYTYFIFSMPARNVLIEIQTQSAIETAPS